MTPDKLSRVDLRLLPSLAVLLDERSVTLAADRMFISQPAMSRTLKRLRELFDDKLLVTVQGAPTHDLTPFARDLQAQLTAALNEISKLLTLSKQPEARIFTPGRAIVQGRSGRWACM